MCVSLSILYCIIKSNSLGTLKNPNIDKQNWNYFSMKIRIPPIIAGNWHELFLAELFDKKV